MCFAMFSNIPLCRLQFEQESCRTIEAMKSCVPKGANSPTLFTREELVPLYELMKPYRGAGKIENLREDVTACYDEDDRPNGSYIGTIQALRKEGPRSLVFHVTKDVRQGEFPSYRGAVCSFGSREHQAFETINFPNVLRMLKGHLSEPATFDQSRPNLSL